MQEYLASLFMYQQELMLAYVQATNASIVSSSESLSSLNTDSRNDCKFILAVRNLLKRFNLRALSVIRGICFNEELVCCCLVKQGGNVKFQTKRARYVGILMVQPVIRKIIYNKLLTYYVYPAIIDNL
jgi:hypothetical protein